MLVQLFLFASVALTIALADSESCDIRSSHSNSTAEIETFLNKVNHFLQQECPLFKDDKEFNNQQHGLSDYWAQEYTGSDLFRDLLIENHITLDKGKRNFDVLDGIDDDHGTLVSGLITGPTNSALIPSSNPLIFISDHQDEDFIEYYANGIDNSFPPYINSSMRWSDEKLNVYKWISTNYNSLIITSAGNDGNNRELDSNKKEAAANLNVIVVGSVSPSGEISTFSQFSENVFISAPSDHYLLSAKDKKPHIFGGTSGATPQVTAALAAFSLVTGYSLNKDEATELLKLTAFIQSEDKSRQKGFGILNSYKIGRIAFKLKETCHDKKDIQRDTCISQYLKKKETYSFPPRDLTSAKKAFATCFPNEDQSEATCEERQSFFKMIREEALLNPNPILFRSLSCISKMYGFFQNSNFYEKMASNYL